MTADEAADLREDFDAIAAAEARYRLDGLSMTERADLDRRFDELADRIQWERADREEAQASARGIASTGRSRWR